MNKRSAETSRSNILHAARSVFAEHGYAQASMRAIAGKAGISVGGLYIYFRNKEDLYVTFMQDWMTNLNDRTREALVKIDDPVKAIDAFITVAIQFARDNREIIALQGHERGFSFGTDFKRNFSLQRRNTIAEIIRKGVEKEIFVDCDPHQAAGVIFNMLRGYVVSMMIDEDSLFNPDEGVNLILRGLLRRRAG